MASVRSAIEVGGKPSRERRAPLMSASSVESRGRPGLWIPWVMMQRFHGGIIGNVCSLYNHRPLHSFHTVFLAFGNARSLYSACGARSHRRGRGLLVFWLASAGDRLPRRCTPRRECFN